MATLLNGIWLAVQIVAWAACELAIATWDTLHAGKSAEEQMEGRE